MKLFVWCALASCWCPLAGSRFNRNNERFRFAVLRESAEAAPGRIQDTVIRYRCSFPGGGNGEGTLVTTPRQAPAVAENPVVPAGDWAGGR